MTDCWHEFCSDKPPTIICKKCGIKPRCEKRKHGQKTHWFHKGNCVYCGLSQRKIASYVEIKS